MKLSLMVFLMCVAALGQSKDAAQRPAGVPAGAVAIEGHTWRWVDKEGKAWLYRPGPFGMMKSEEPKQAGAGRPAGVPAGAVAVSEGVWKWTDPGGKVWMYQQTPAGLMKSEEAKGADARKGPTGIEMGKGGSDAALAAITVKEEGDTLRFSKPGPFGTYSWTKKKAELDKDEAMVWERARTKAAAKKD
jgi:hypothetical protein